LVNGEKGSVDSVDQRTKIKRGGGEQRDRFLSWGKILTFLNKTQLKVCAVKRKKRENNDRASFLIDLEERGRKEGGGGGGVSFRGNRELTS